MDNPVWHDPKLLKLWMLCLLEASHKEHEQLVGRQVVKLQPGQFVTGRFQIAKLYNEGAKKSDIVPEITLWRWMKWLEKNDFLSIESTTKYSIVTIKNWFIYQQNGQLNNQKSEQQIFENNHWKTSDTTLTTDKNEQQMNIKRTSNEHEMNTNNNGNNNLEEDEEEANPIKLFEKNFGVMNPIQMDKVWQWVDDFNGNKKVVCMAIEETALKNPMNPFSYLERVLLNWHQRGLLTVEDVIREKQKFEQSKVVKIPRRQPQTQPKKGVDWEKLRKMFAEEDARQAEGDA